MAFRPDSPFYLPNGRRACGPHRRGICDICCVDYDYLYEDEDEDLYEEINVFHYEVDPEMVEEGLRGLGSTPSDPHPAGSGSPSVQTVFVGYNDFVPSPPRPNLPAYISSVSRSPGPNLSANISSVSRSPGPNLLDRTPFGPRISFTGRVFPREFVPPQPTDSPQMLFPLSRGPPSFCGPSYKARFIRANNKRQFLIYTDGACSANGRAAARAGCSFIYKNGSQEWLTRSRRWLGGICP